MIEVQDLVKTYGSQRALDGISFSARPGEVLGFLGPNGAGKTTTMKILTGYLSATEGTAIVGGHNVAEDSLAVRRVVGYLPEHNPLYGDMYVREYLRFAARTHKLRGAKARIDELVEMTGLTREVHKPIGALSKGYRQRVGLAQAMLHDPEVLILDEPTSGLDPNQLAEIRALIRSIGNEKTVVFSTHIMQEVQAICDRVVIIDRGRLVADDPIEKLRERATATGGIVVQFDKRVDANSLSEIAGVHGVNALPAEHAYQLTFRTGDDPRPAIFKFAVDHGIVLLEIRREDRSVEDVFRALTS